MEQSTFAELQHDTKKRRTRREVFLEKMDALIPWGRLEARIEPFYRSTSTVSNGAVSVSTTSRTSVVRRSRAPRI